MQRLSIVFVSSVLALSAAVGGCVSGDDKDADPSSSSSPTDSDAPATTTPTSSAGPTTTDEPNTPPELTLTPSVGNGSAPLDITFALDASDAEDDSLAWTMDADGDGASDANGTEDDLPAEFLFTYDVAGVYNATFAVSDGENDVDKTVTVTVEASSAFTDLVFAGTLSGLWVGGAGGVSEYLPPDAEEVHTFDLTAAPSSITFNLTWDGMQGFDMDFRVYDPAGVEVAKGTGVQDPGDSAEPSVTLADPAILSRLGTWSISVVSAGSAECDYELVVDFA
jgi:hypothetical protein